jgi:hypothetical protein
MTDRELARAFERGDVPNAAFNHAAHLRVAWAYLGECGSIAAAAARMSAGLRRFAAAAWKVEKYHHTITVFWMEALAIAGSTMAAAPAEDVLRAHPQLLDKDLPLAFYSPDRLFSDEARLGWLAPDRQPVTADAPAFRSADPSRDASNRPLSRRPS